MVVANKVVDYTASWYPYLTLVETHHRPNSFLWNICLSTISLEMVDEQYPQGMCESWYRIDSLCLRAYLSSTIDNEIIHMTNLVMSISMKPFTIHWSVWSFSKNIVSTINSIHYSNGSCRRSQTHLRGTTGSFFSVTTCSQYLLV